MKKKNNLNFRRILHWYYQLTRPVIWLLGGAFVAYGISNILTSVVQPYLWKIIIDAMTTKSMNIIWMALVIYLISHLAQALVHSLADVFIVKYEGPSQRLLRNAIMDRMLDHSEKFYSNIKVGGLVSTFKRFVASHIGISDVLAFEIFPITIQVIGAWIVTFIVSPLLGGVLIAWSLLYMAYSFWMASRRYPYHAEVAENDSRVSGYFADVMANISTVKLFSAGARERSSFGELTGVGERIILKTWNHSNIQNFVQRILGFVLILGMMVLMIILWQKGTITVGSVVMVYAYLSNMRSNLWRFSHSYSRIIRDFADAQEMVDILDRPVDIVDVIASDERDSGDLSICFENCTFAYHHSPILKDFSLTIPFGKSIGFVGNKGAGKSTLIKILLRMHDLSEGTIRIGDININEVPQDQWRKFFAVIPQQPSLFDRTIAENIAYGNPEADLNMIIEVAKKASAHEFIQNLPKGYETLVGERGVRLSGGQAQCIALARALLSDAPILILDEATSSLDSKTEDHIRSILEKEKDRTLIVIAHRLATVVGCDEICVLQDGAIVQSGTHEDLFADQSGAYYELVRSQVYLGSDEHHRAPEACSC